MTTTLPLIFAMTAGASNALVGVLTKQAERVGCRPGVAPVLFLGTVALLGAVLLPFAGGSWGVPGLWCLAGSMGAIFVVTLRATIVANRACPPSLVWSLANLGLVVPILLAPLVLREPWHGLDALIIVAFVAMLHLSQRGMAQAREPVPASWPALLPLAVVFLGNGLLMLGYKLKTFYWPQTGSMPFTVMVFGSGALIGLLMHAPARQSRITRAEWGWGVAMGLAAGAANISLLGAVVLPAVVAFPVIQGIALTGGVLLMLALFRERLTGYKIAGLLCGGLVLVLAILR